MGVLLNALHLLHETAYKIVIDTEGSMIDFILFGSCIYLTRAAKNECIHALSAFLPCVHGWCKSKASLLQQALRGNDLKPATAHYGSEVVEESVTAHYVNVIAARIRFAGRRVQKQGGVHTTRHFHDYDHSFDRIRA